MQLSRFSELYSAAAIALMAIACGLAACDNRSGNVTDNAMTVSQNGEDEMAQTVARSTKKLNGQCTDDADCDQKITDADLQRAKQDLTQVAGTSAFGPKSTRAPSVYFSNLQTWSCRKSLDECKREWFAVFQADIRQAVKEGDDSDDPWTIPKDKSEVTAETPYTRDDLIAANVSFEAIDNVWMCRSAVMYRRWRKAGDASTTKADLQDALHTCFSDQPSN